MGKSRDILAVLERIHQEIAPLPAPSVTNVAAKKHDPFRILISTIISLRTKDQVTEEASNRLFALADTPAAMKSLPRELIQQAIFPAGFYRNKSKQILEIANRIDSECNGEVPKDRDLLLSFPGVGIKTANLTLGLGYGLPYICVDTHVHRIPNRLGWISTESPQESEVELMKILPKEWWIPINHLLVKFGQQICKPVSPHCSTCPISSRCPRKGVERWR